MSVEENVEMWKLYIDEIFFAFVTAYNVQRLVRYIVPIATATAFGSPDAVRFRRATSIPCFYFILFYWVHKSNNNYDDVIQNLQQLIIHLQLKRSFHFA